MAILQISKIQQRSGNLVDLPQLDDAEFGWANDAKRLFIGKTTPNENIEILTSYSTINFSQVDGAVGNLNISSLTIDDGQILTYDGSNWVNRGGTAGGLITLGNISNVKIDGGAIGYVLQTDGTGNLSWAPKGTLVSGILNVTQSNPAVVTTTSDNFFISGAQITIVDPQGMNELAGNIYYANVLTTTTFELYTDSSLTSNVDSSSYNAYSYTTVSATTVSTNVITVADATVFTEGQAVRFVGDMSASGIENDVTYYVANAISTSLKVANSPEGNLEANIVPLQTTTGLTAEVYAIDGQAVSSFSSGASFGIAEGTSTMVQFNTGGLLDASSDFTFDKTASPKLLNLNGNANVGNLNATSNVLAANLNSTGMLSVVGNANVGNIGAATAIITTGNITTINTGLVQNGNSNVTISSNGNVTIHAVGGPRIIATSSGANLIGTLFVTGNANVGNLGTTQVLATANVTAPQFISNIATGTAPFIVNSTTQVANLSVANAGFATSAGSATTAWTVTTAAQPNITSVGTLTSLTVNGALTTTQITTGANTTPGNITGNWTLTAGSRLQATYADLAEYYEADDVYAWGTVLEFGGDKEITLATNETTRVAGVVSKNPAYVMNATCPGLLTAVALQGRVPCKVMGSVRKGDIMVSAGDGYAKACTAPILGTVIGKSLVDFDGAEGIIEVAVGRL